MARRIFYIVVVLFILLMSTGLASATWFNTSWLYAQNVTVNSTVNEALTNFPVGAKFNTQELITAGKIKPDCSDIRITNESGAIMYYEVEACNTTQSVIWFNAPLIPASTLVTYVLYYGNNASVDAQDPANLWRASNYGSVWHLHNLTDSLGKNTLSGAGGTNSVVSNTTTCKYGKCIKLEQAASYLENNSFTGISIGSVNSTVTGFFYMPSTSSGFDIVGYGNPNNYQSRNVRVNVFGANTCRMTIYGDPSGPQLIINAADYNLKVSYIAMMLTSANSGLVCLNTNCTASTGFGATAATTNTRFSIGSSSEAYLQARIAYAAQPVYVDEFRVANVSRTINWLAAEYQHNTTLSAEYTQPSGVTAPNITAVVVDKPIYDDNNIRCYVNGTGDNETLTANFEWFNNSVSYNTGSYNITNGTYTQISTITAGYTQVADNWTCKVQLCKGVTCSGYLEDSVKVRGISFMFADPSDLTAGSLFDKNLYSTYRYYDTDVTAGSFKIYHKTNTSTSDVTYYINGTGYSGYINGPKQNTTINVTGNITENEIYPASYNIDPRLMGNTSHLSGSLNGNNVRLYMTLNNISNYQNFSFIEFMINATSAGAPSMTIRYCNSSFNPLTSGDPVGNTNCGICGSKAATIGYNHSHSEYSKHNLISFNATNSKICGVGATSSGTFVFTSPSNVASWTYYYYPNASGGFYTSNNGGGTVTAINGVLDMHVHQYGYDTTYYEYMQYEKATGDLINSTLRYDFLDPIPLPPTSPIVTSPANETIRNGLFSKKIPVAWTGSEAYLGVITNYVGYVRHAGNMSVKSQLFNVSAATREYNTCAANLSYGTYVVEVVAYDNNSNTAAGYSDAFISNNTLTSYVTAGTVANGSYVSNTYYAGCYYEGGLDVRTITRYYLPYLADDCTLTGKAYQGYFTNWRNISFTVPAGCDYAGLVWNCSILNDVSSADLCNVTYAVPSTNIVVNINNKTPDLSISSPINSTYYSTSGLPYNITLNYTTYDVYPTTCSYQIDSNPVVNVTNCANVSVAISSYGSHVLAVTSTDAGGLSTTRYASFNVLAAPELAINYGNYSGVSGINYTRKLEYNLTYTCNTSAIIQRYINNVNDLNITPICDSSVHVYTGYYVRPTETAYNISFKYEYDLAYKSFNEFFSDLNNPTISYLGLSFISGFTTTTAVINVSCTDISPTLLYNISLNTDVIFIGNKTSGAEQYNTSSSFAYGPNTLTAICSDSFGSTKLNVTEQVYSAIVYIIDEITGSTFDVSNLSKVRLYRDDNSSYFDFKANATNSVNVTALGNEKLRLELTYSDNVIITRYLDLSLLNNSNVRLCANLEGTTHYEQLIISASEAPVLLKSDYANCYVAADYTRFAYQSGYLLKAFSIARGYSLYNFVDDEANYLASIDGSLASYINLDSIEFSKDTVEINTRGESLTFNKLGNGTIKIRYQNGREDIEQANVTIRELDSSTIVYSNAAWADPNNLDFVFNYSAYGNTSTFFTIKIEKVDNRGVISTITRYFNGSGFARVLRAEFAAVIALVILVAGLTIASWQTTTSWLGGMMSLGAVVVLAFAIPEWYIIFIQVIAALICIYLSIVPFIVKKVNLV